MSDASGIAKWQTIAPVTYYITTSSQACTGTGNVCYGRVTLFQNTKGVQNTGIGDFAL